jgi:hypothetical protein
MPALKRGVNMKKVFALLLISAMIFPLTGCVRNSGSADMVNPVHKSSADEILQTLGITMNLPEDAEDAKYSIIDVNEGEPIAQAQFKLDGLSYTYRIRSSPEMEDISGAYYDWESVKNIEVYYCEGELCYNEGREGVCLWYDAATGLMYSLFTDTGATEETLLALANDLFVPSHDILLDGSF